MPASDNVAQALDFTLQNNVQSGAQLLNGTAAQVGGLSSMTLEVSGASFAATVVVEGTIGGSQWDGLPVINLTTGQVVLPSAGITATGKYLVPLANVGQVRARIQAIPSGSCTVVAKASAADPPYVLVASPATATPAPANVSQIAGAALALGQQAAAASLPVVIASNQPLVPVSIQAGFLAASSSTPMPCQDVNLEAIGGTTADAAAASVAGDVAGSLIAQLKALVRMGTQLDVLLRGWKRSELAALRALARALSAQAGAYIPVGGDDDTDGEDVGGGGSM